MEATHYLIHPNMYRTMAATEWFCECNGHNYSQYVALVLGNSISDESRNQLLLLSDHEDKVLRFLQDNGIAYTHCLPGHNPPH